MDSYKRNALGTFFLFFFSSYNVIDIYNMIFYFASYSKTADLTWRAWVNLALSLLVLVVQGFALRSRFYALTHASALHDPVEGKKNKRWILIYIFTRIFVFLYFIFNAMLYVPNKKSHSRYIPPPELGPFHIIYGVLQDTILLILWKVGGRKKGSARKLLPFYQEQQNQFPTQQF